MYGNSFNRRDFLSILPSFSLTPMISKGSTLRYGRYPISCNAYNWVTFYQRDGKLWGKDPDQDIAEFASTGIKAFEPSFSDKEKALALIPVLRKYQIEMPSIYVNSVLHEKEGIEKSINTVLGIADVVKSYGTRIIVTNPSPISWGSKELKTDAQLIIQSQALERLGLELKKRGLTLAYHTHDMELRAGAREFHHTLLNTDPENVSFCFDVHWIFRGSENSEVAVFDVLKLYGKRIVELHLRQSVNGIWSESFANKGDIDYERFALELARLNIKPHLVIEQCLEAASPKKLDVVQAHIRDLEVVKATFLQ